MSTTAFLTDSTLCIGCKACEVALEWNQIPGDGFVWSGQSYDNTGALGHATWRHVKFVENGVVPGLGGNSHGVFRRTFASIAKMRAAWRPVLPAQSFALSLAAFTSSRMSATAAPIALSRARSASLSGMKTTAEPLSAPSAMTARKRDYGPRVPRLVRPNPLNLGNSKICNIRRTSG